MTPPDVSPPILSAGSPDVDDLRAVSPDLLVPFRVRKLLSPRVLWIDEDYARSRGAAMDEAGRARLCDWLLDRFAYCVPEEWTLPFMRSEETVFYADRYGKSDGSHYGGSGRCGLSGGFNVKGVGVTPMVGSTYLEDWFHRTGELCFDDCVKEAIFSKIVAAEFPFGGVPVVAIIDTGILDFADSRRCLLVRPNFTRLGYLERSVFFGTSGDEGSDQYFDSGRVASMARAFWSDEGLGPRLGTRSRTIKETLTRFAHQVAYAHVHRISLGALSTSNMTLDGALLDYQALTTVPNWTKVHEVPFLPPFGDEWRQIIPMIDSLCFFQRKYTDRAEGVGEIASSVQAALRTGFMDCLGKALRLRDPARHPQEAAVLKLLRRYFDDQQRRHQFLDDDRWDWISAQPSAPDREPAPGQRVYQAIVDALRSPDPAPPLHEAHVCDILEALEDWAALRRPLFKPVLTADVVSLRTAVEDPNACAIVSEYIAAAVQASRI